ncbi:MAG: leucine-rich repeat domain-containing protein [Candidatus Methanomethylophilaceae archaeon]|nr:leucine-rich repeat domain-containing protein [Candidatus Methanomethylophilaceae archaeon]
MTDFIITDNLRWRIEDSTLYIESVDDGAMADYVTNNQCFSPWYTERSRITEVIVSDGVASIGAGAFYDCYKVERITIPESVKSIGSQAFHNCEKLKNLTFPSGVESIGDYAFTFCTSLRSITFTSKEPPKVGRNMFETFAESDAMVTLYGQGIDSEVFGDESIGNNGKITFEIGGRSDSITWSIAEGVLKLSMSRDRDAQYKPFVENNVCSAPWHRYRTGIHSATVNSGFRQLNDGLFFDCTFLKRVELPEVESIGKQAFHNCRSLESLVLPSSVKRIGDFAFTFCTSLKLVHLGTPWTPEMGYHMFDTVPGAGIITLKGPGWNDASSLSYDFIGENAKVTFDVNGSSDNIEWFLKNGVLTVRPIMGGDGSMEQMVENNVCSAPWHKYAVGIFSAVVEDGMTNIGAGAFYDCVNMEEIDLPLSIESVGFQAFHNCRSLRYITFQMNVKEIGDYAFTFCASLKDLYFLSIESPEFGLGLFDGCPDDKEIRIHRLGWLPRNNDIKNYKMVRFVKIGE